MKKIIYTICISFIFSQSQSYSIDKIKPNPRKKYPFGISLNLLGPSGHLALSVNTFVIPKINIELGMGVFNNDDFFTPRSFLGVKYHFGGNSISKTTFYIGVYDAISFDFQKHNLYFPIGVSRIKKNHFTWSVELAFQPTKIYYDSTLWGAIKVGYQFGFHKRKKIFNKNN
jgi:hypothetical protein